MRINTLTLEEMDDISNKINSQKGQNYSCSNQSIVCGYFSTINNWNNFIRELKLKDKIKCYGRYFIKLKNGETWNYFYKDSYLCIGYRFYKIKVDRTIDRQMFFENVYPYCTMYCSEIEWI